MADSSRSARTCDVSLGSGGEERLPTGTPLTAKGNGGANSPVHGSAAVAPGCMSAAPDKKEQKKVSGGRYSTSWVGRCTGSSETPSSALERGIFSLSNALLGTSELPVQRPTQLVEYLPPVSFFSPVLSGAADLRILHPHQHPAPDQQQYLYCL